MIKKIIFAGCSITAGNELWEEAHVPGYGNMNFEQARKVMNSGSLPDDSIIEAYNNAHSYPALIGQKLGVEVENLGISGISNKEIAGRIISRFPEDKYEDTVVFLQFTTHNRMLLKYKETDETHTIGSFVVMPKGNDDRLTRGQNNLLKEMFFEFLPETVISAEDHFHMHYAISVLKSKGISAFIIVPEDDPINGNWYSDVKFPKIVSDRSPDYWPEMVKHFVKKQFEQNLLGSTVKDLVGANSQLPRLHFNQEAHNKIADVLSEKLKCLIG